MKHLHLQPIGLFAVLTVICGSCQVEDPGPRQQDEKNYSIMDFDRLEVASALDVTVQQAATFSIRAQGDRRDLSDLELIKQGTTLSIRFKNSLPRQYNTSVTIAMPLLEGADFSGASNGRITGFSEPVKRVDLSLSGGSTVQLAINSESLYVWLTESSTLRVIGAGKTIEASVSGASELTSFEYPVDHVKLMVSGASRAKVNVSEALTVSVSGASEVWYRGSPQIEQDVSGASSVKPD